MKCLSLPDTNTLVELLEEIEGHISSMERLQEDLTEAIEYYADDCDDTLAQASFLLDEACRNREVNEMLFHELNEARKELLRLEDCLHENGIMPAGDCFIHHDRIKPDLYRQDPDSPPVWWRISKDKKPQQFPTELGISPVNILLLYDA